MSKEKFELDMTNSIVRLTTNLNSVNVLEPWRTVRSEDQITGFVIELNQERFILTHSDSFINATYMTASFMDEPAPLKVEVAAINYLCNLALLKCSAPEFLNKAVPLELASVLPNSKSQKKVVIHEFSKKNQYSSVPGNISLIDTSPYYSGAYAFLNLKIGSSAQNFHPYGGPLVYENKVIGVMNDTHAIPLPIIRHFLEHPEGFPQLPFSVQILEHAKTREYYGLNKNQGGLLVVNMYGDSDTSIRPGDVVIEIDDYPFKVDGTIKHPHSENLISYTHLLRMHALGDELKVKIKREGIEITCMLKLDLSLGKPFAVKSRYDETLSGYFAAHGLVISPLTHNFIAELNKRNEGSSWDRARILPKSIQVLSTFKNIIKTPEASKLFIISKILPSVHTVGMDHLLHAVIGTLNGQKIKNMRHLVELLSNKPESGFHTLVLNDNWQIILPHLDYQENLELLKRSGIADQAPLSLMEKHEKTAKRKREETDLDEGRDKKRIKSVGFFATNDNNETPEITVVDTYCQYK